MSRNKSAMRLLTLVVALFMLAALMLTGCTPKTAEPTDTQPSTQAEATDEGPLDPVTLTWYMIGSTNQADEAAVFKAASRYLKEKINAECNFVCFDWGEYNDKMAVKIGAAEEFDICFTSDWAVNYFQNISKGAFQDVTALIPKYAPKKWAAIPKWVWEGLKVKGKLYGVINGFIAWQDMFWFRKDLVEKFKFDITTVKKLADIEPFLKAVKDDDPTMVPFPKQASSEHNFMFSELNIDQIIAWSLPGVVKRDDANLKVFNQYEMPELLEMYKLLHSWYEKEYINQDAATKKDNNDIHSAGKSACAFNGTYYVGQEQEFAAGLPKGMQVVVQPIGIPWVTPESITKTINGISATSKNPERAIMALEISNTDRIFFRLISAGFEGTHYSDLGNNQIKLLDGSKYQPWNSWAWGDLDRNGYTTEGQPFDMLQQKADSGTNSQPSPALGFPMDNEPVKTEFAQIQAVAAQYFPQLITGTADPVVTLPEFNAKLKAAGLDKYLQEVQKQIDEWKAAKQ